MFLFPTHIVPPEVAPTNEKDDMYEIVQTYYNGAKHGRPHVRKYNAKAAETRKKYLDAGVQYYGSNEVVVEIPLCELLTKLLRVSDIEVEVVPAKAAVAAQVNITGKLDRLCNSFNNPEQTKDESST